MKSKAIVAGFLSTLTLAQKMDDLVWLTASFPEAGQINYIDMHERDGKPMHLEKAGDWKPLVTGLAYPTYTAYDFENQWLYVCDCDQIVQFQIDFDDTNN